MNGELLSAGAAAERLGVTRQTVRNRVIAGELRAIAIRGVGGALAAHAFTPEAVELNRLTSKKDGAN